MRKIKLTKNKFALVNDEDFEYLSQWKWHYHGDYAVRTDHPRRTTLYMHRLILNTPTGFVTDHINRNKLDNRRENLRVVSRTGNQINKGLQKNNSSGYRGVHWRPREEKWAALLIKDKKRIELGYYSNIQGAWLARRLAERIYYGEPIQT